MKRRLFAALLAAVMILFTGVNAYAAEDLGPSFFDALREEEGTPLQGGGTAQEAPQQPQAPQNADVEAKRLTLEQKYGVNIRYDVDPDGTASIGTGSLATLDKTLEQITPQVVSQVSAHYQKTRGKALTFSFVYSPFQQMGFGFDVLGSFEYATATIELYIPSYGRDVAMTGDGPLTIAHEFGHAFHAMAAPQYGEQQLEREWLACNGGVPYNGPYFVPDYNETAFASSYGATNYDEDFAELFAHLFVRGKDGMGMGALLQRGGQSTALGKKAALVEKLLGLYIGNAQTAAANLRKVYAAAPTVTYKGVVLGGESLQFMGCAYPRYILRSLLYEIGLEAQQSTWVYEIGGWEVASAHGTYLVFPGGEWHRLSGQMAA